MERNIRCMKYDICIFGSVPWTESEYFCSLHISGISEMLTTTSTLQNLKHGSGRCSDQGDPGEPGAVREEASPHREVAGQAALQISS